ncbi:MAG: aldose epimerase family protein [Rikenellaceae bacterium]
MNITQRHFGTYLGDNVSLYTLSNDNGMEVKVMDYGATITSVLLPDGAQIACGFNTFDEYFGEEYLANAPYFGSTVGRYCSQIKDARFSIEGVEYQLKQNCGENNLHGGTWGFDKRLWSAEILELTNGVGLTFSLVSTDGEEGFPGEVVAKVTMILDNEDKIIFKYLATTTKQTPLSMTNHTYFNLAAFERDVEDFVVKINSTKLMETDASGAATGVILDVVGNCNDLSQSARIGNIHKALGEGVEHFYIFDNPDQELKQYAKIGDAKSGRAIEVYSTEPCMLFYTAKHMSDKLQRSSSERYGKHRAFACETHRWQNGVNIEAAPNSFTSPEKSFESTTIFRFFY